MTTGLDYQEGCHTTRWTRVCLAKSDSEDGRRALSELCEAYYEPVLFFLRCRMKDPEAAREMAHAFFARMLEGGQIQTADGDRGRFRHYLLGAVKHFLYNTRQSAACLRRGGGVEQVPMEHHEVFAVADAGQVSPDAEFDRRWAVTVLARGLEALRMECVAGSRGPFFERVRPLLIGSATHGDQSGIAAECGMSVAALRMAVHRLRKRLQEYVRREVAGTLEDPGMVREEMRTLLLALGD